MADSMIGMMVYVCYSDAGVIHNVTMHNYALLCVMLVLWLNYVAF